MAQPTVPSSHPFPSLVLPRGHLGPVGNPRRRAAIAEARSLPGPPPPGTFTSLTGGPLPNGDDVGVEKPGNKWPQVPTDMRPTVLSRGVRLDWSPPFEQVYDAMQQLAVDGDRLSLDLFACLAFRACWMLDHQQVAPGVWRYRPPATVVADIAGRSPELGPVAAETFLHLVDAIALNEDVRFDEDGYDITQGYGRANNLKTSAGVAAVFLGRMSAAAFIGRLVRRPAGVAPMPRVEAESLFPLLTPTPMVPYRP